MERGERGVEKGKEGRKESGPTRLLSAGSQVYEGDQRESPVNRVQRVKERIRIHNHDRRHDRF